MVMHSLPFCPLEWVALGRIILHSFFLAVLTVDAKKAIREMHLSPQSTVGHLSLSKGKTRFRRLEEPLYLKPTKDVKLKLLNRVQFVIF